MNKILLAVVLQILFFDCPVWGQTDGLRKDIEKIIAGKRTTVGVAIAGPEESDTVSIHGDRHFPLQSVFKFHIALTVLDEVDKKTFSLQQKILIRKGDLLPNTWSPIREKYPLGNVQLPLSRILQYTVADSDNNGCDILLRLVGGPKKVSDYIHRAGISDFNIQASEADMHKDWNVQFNNWTTPLAAVALLKKFYQQKMPSAKTHAFLWKTMTQASTGGNRIPKSLPAGTVVAHKTGTSGTNAAGLTAAINDIGIVSLPNGHYFTLAVFVTNTKEDTETNEQIIADIAKLAWDYFTGKK